MNGIRLLAVAFVITLIAVFRPTALDGQAVDTTQVIALDSILVTDDLVGTLDLERVTSSTSGRDSITRQGESVIVTGRALP